jgi:dTDP-4-amino-4,6-dideoxygalactose transaminase
LSDPIYVTRPFLPPLQEALPLLEKIWTSRVLTNQGEFHRALEERLRAFLEVEHLSLTCNGMLALSAAIEAAGIDGEVVTTPYSFVATAHAVRLERLKPVFADIRPDDLNIDPAAIEAAITPRTTAIVAVHVYGNPCDVEAIEGIARRHGLKVIYDAAHAFGVRLNGRSVLSWGDFSTLSFHATKAFNTFEGGAVVSGSVPDREAVERYRNFGILNETEIPAVGTNAKMSEFNAAMGLLQLDHWDEIRAGRAAVDRRYREGLADVAGIDCLAIPAGAEPNHSYFPILVRPDFPLSRDGLYERLKQRGIWTRRYFYPLLSDLPHYRDVPSAQAANLPVAAAAAAQILCLPIYPDLAAADQDRILSVVLDAARQAARVPAGA